MNATLDFVIESRDEQPILVVEAKNTTSPSREWAARMRRNLFAHARIPRAPYFLLALRNNFYLWKQTSSIDVVPPDYEIPAEDVLKPYLESFQTTLESISQESFESLMRVWLTDLLAGGLSSDGSSPVNRWLQDSRLYEKVQDGVIKPQAVR